MSFKEYFMERKGEKFRKLIVVDVQPLYAESIENKFSISDFGAFMSNVKKEVLYFYNGPETIGSDDSHDAIADWLVEHHKPLENYDWDKVNFLDKGYSFYRSWMDAGVSNNGMIKALRFMYTNRIYDSREINVDDWKTILPEKDFHAIEDALKHDDDDFSIWTPDISISDLRNDWNNSLLCGGGMNECLKEIQILMNAFNISYKLVDKFIYY